MHRSGGPSDAASSCFSFGKVLTVTNIEFPSSSEPVVPASALEQAKEDLDRIEKELAIGGFLPDPMRPQAGAMRRVPAAAIRAAIELMENHSVKLGGIDVEKAHRALEYEEAIVPIVARLRSVAARLDDSLMAIWHGPALQASAVYGAARSMDRLPEAQVVREQLKSMGQHMAPHRHRGKAVAAAPTVVAATVAGTLANGTLDKPT
jgi:hypothetical protein